MTRESWRSTASLIAALVGALHCLPARPADAYDAGAGRKKAEEACAGCHGPALAGAQGPPLEGPAFRSKWRKEPLSALFIKIRYTMPPAAADAERMAPEQGADRRAQHRGHRGGCHSVSGRCKGNGRRLHPDDGLSREYAGQGAGPKAVTLCTRNYPPA